MEREAKRLVPNVSQRTSRHIQVADRTIAVRAMLIKSESLRDAIDRAYLNKYHTPGVLKYAKDLAEALFIQMILGDDRAIRATYVGGKLAHDRGDPQFTIHNSQVT